MTVEKYTDIQVANIKMYDAPDFVDAFIESATAVLNDGTMRDATEAELEELSGDSEFVHQQVLKRLY